MTKNDTWYVSYSPDKSSRALDKALPGGRVTRTFKSEDEAKQFAREIIEKGWTVSAGTLNPHQPRQTIAPRLIEKWADPHAF
jgi:hypothetical protein